jgi:hypothetical protein
MRTPTLIIPLVLCFLISAVIGLKVGHAWKGYSPQCDRECSEVGEICDTGKETICCMAGKCSSKFGLSVCDAPLISFTCNPIPQDDLIKQAIDPKLYPNLYNKP